MKVLYVARHASGDNDDEGAIAYALRELGHEVVEAHERRAVRKHHPRALAAGCDLCLFHKWEETLTLRELSKELPCVFWYFDMVDCDDPTLRSRCDFRRRWMAVTAPMCTAGFCTDGDWVEAWNRGLAPGSANGPAMHHLMQGADGRVVGPGAGPAAIDLLFAGMVRHGAKRESHVQELQRAYGARFLVRDGVRGRVHGRDLADLYASARAVVAPDGPSTDLYWSNRVYQASGFRAFILHPACAGLREHYAADELATYSSRDEFHELAEQYLSSATRRAEVAEAGYRRTLKDHLYKHRVEELLRCALS